MLYKHRFAEGTVSRNLVSLTKLKLSNSFTFLRSHLQHMKNTIRNITTKETEKTLRGKSFKTVRPCTLTLSGLCSSTSVVCSYLNIIRLVFQHLISVFLPKHYPACVPATPSCVLTLTLSGLCSSTSVVCSITG
jgi:hypothetical protein